MYDVKDLGSLIPGGEVEPRAINYAGHVVGKVTVQGGLRHAFYWSNQSGIKDLGCLPGDDQSEALDINDSNSLLVILYQITTHELAFGLGLEACRK